MELTGASGEGWAIVVHVANEVAAVDAEDLGALALDAPVVDGLEEGHDLVLLLETNLGGVHRGEGERALVPGLEVEVGREEGSCLEVEVGSALGAGVD